MKKTGVLKKTFKLGALPLAFVYLELINRICAELEITGLNIIGCLFTAAALSLLIYSLCALAESKITRRLLCFAALEVITLWFVISFFTYDSYKVFMSPVMVATEAGDVATGFTSELMTVLTGGFPVILLFHVPSLLILILGDKLIPEYERRFRASSVLFAFALLFAVSAWAVNRTDSKYSREYTYDDAVKRFGVVHAFPLELARTNSGKDESTAIEFTAHTSPEPVKNTEPEADAPAETGETVYGYNAIDIDFEELARTEKSSKVSSLHSYVASQTPSRKNKYTGLFSGKNLIMITAEAFSSEVIDPERTPTLYRLANKGIVFENFYQPAWGGSTSTGEFSFLTGLVPALPYSMSLTIGKDMPYTMGNQLRKLNYSSWAFHDGDYDYYDRNNTHPNLGYDKYYAIGNGLRMTDEFPRSDLEMMEKTVDLYIDLQPFSVYYMTISGHANYSLSPQVNRMAAKNEAAVSGMECSDKLKAYFACQEELEYALEYLVSRLEEKGIAGDTVIAIVSDHYPYGLCRSTTWENRSDSLGELYGYEAETDAQRDHSTGIIWCGSLEDGEPIRVSAPASTIDMVPTLSNLFGLEFDSRLYAGRDVFSDKEALVIWNNHSWMTEKGYYEDGEGFTPFEGFEPDEEYIARIGDSVGDAKKFSEEVLNTDYYGRLFSE